MIHWYPTEGTDICNLDLGNPISIWSSSSADSIASLPEPVTCTVSSKPCILTSDLILVFVQLMEQSAYRSFNPAQVPSTSESIPDLNGPFISEFLRVLSPSLI